MKRTKNTPVAVAEVPTAVVEATPVDAGRLEMILLTSIVESDTNPRKTFHGLEELADSIVQTGVHQPVVVRPMAVPSVMHDYELVFGARRFRACKLAGVKEIPAIVREMTDAAVREAQLIENNQREDVNPMEEAMAYQQAADLDGYTVAKLAAKVGRSESYVQQRMQLLKLHEDFQTMLLQGKMTLGHAKCIARAGADYQSQMLDEWEWKDWKEDDFEPPFLSEVKAMLKESYLKLAGVAFPTDDATLLPEAGACTTCPKRTGFNRALFDDIDPKDDQCADCACFNTKLAAFVAIKATELSMKGVTFTRAWSGGHIPGEHEAQCKADGVKPLGYGVIELTAKDAKAMAPADVVTVLLVGGDRAGKVIKIAAPKAKLPDGGMTRGAGSFTNSDDTYKDQRAAEARKQRAGKAAMDRIREDLLKAARAEPLAVVSLRMIARETWIRSTNDASKAVAKALGWEKPKEQYAGYAKQAMKYIAAADADTLIDFLLLLTVHAMQYQQYCRGITESAVAACKDFALDPKKILNEETAKLKAKKKGKGKAKKNAEPEGDEPDGSQETPEDEDID